MTPHDPRLADRVHSISNWRQWVVSNNIHYIQQTIKLGSVGWKNLFPARNVTLFPTPTVLCLQSIILGCCFLGWIVYWSSRWGQVGLGMVKLTGKRMFASQNESRTPHHLNDVGKQGNIVVIKNWRGDVMFQRTYSKRFRVPDSGAHYRYYAP